MTPELIDTHCHVHFNAYKNDSDEVIRRALAEKVAMIAVGTQSTTSKNAIATAEKYDGVWASVALHPNHLYEMYIDEAESPFRSREEDFDSAYYRALALHTKCVAIGECGIDYFHLPKDTPFGEVKAKQERIFRAHLDLADEAGKPVIVHCRDGVQFPPLPEGRPALYRTEGSGAGLGGVGALPLTPDPLPQAGEREAFGAHDEVIRILTEYVRAGKLVRRGVIHCYSSDWAHAEQYFALGFLISFTGTITFPPKKSAPKVQEDLLDTVRRAPLTRIMIETDAPYLTPIPHRGERNDPRHVRFVAEKVAEIKGLDLVAVARATTENARTIFRVH